jgi:hypothetical protein
MHEKITIILKNKKKYITITKNSNRKQTKKQKNNKKNLMVAISLNST